MLPVLHSNTVALTSVICNCMTFGGNKESDFTVGQWLKWSCEAVVWGGDSPDEARLEQSPYPFQTQLIWHYLGI